MEKESGRSRTSDFAAFLCLFAKWKKERKAGNVCKTRTKVPVLQKNRKNPSENLPKKEILWDKFCRNGELTRIFCSVKIKGIVRDAVFIFYERNCNYKSSPGLPKYIYFIRRVFYEHTY